MDSGCGGPCARPGPPNAAAMTAAPISAIERFMLFLQMVDGSGDPVVLPLGASFSAPKPHDRARVPSFLQCLLHLAQRRLSVTLCFLDVALPLQLGASRCLANCPLGLADSFIRSALDLVSGSTAHRTLQMGVRVFVRSAAHT